MASNMDKQPARNIHQRIAAITAAVGGVKKTGTNTEQKYQYIEYDEVTAVLRGLMAEHGITVLQNMKEGGRQQTEISSKYGSKGFHVLIDFIFTVTNVDDPTDKLKFYWQGEAADYGDKATNKAATGAEKYFLLKLFKIGSKDDPDRESPDLGSTNGSRQANIVEKHEASPTSKELLLKAGKALKEKGFSREEALLIMTDLAGVDDPSMLTKNMLQTVIATIESEDPDSLARHLPASSFADMDIADDELTQPEPHKYTVPTFINSQSGMPRPEMIKLYKQWLEQVGLITPEDIASFVGAIIGVDHPVSFKDYLEVLKALAFELNSQGGKDA